MGAEMGAIVISKIGAVSKHGHHIQALEGNCNIETTLRKTRWTLNRKRLGGANFTKEFDRSE